MKTDFGEAAVTSPQRNQPPIPTKWVVKKFLDLDKFGLALFTLPKVLPDTRSRVFLMQGSGCLLMTNLSAW